MRNRHIFAMMKMAAGIMRCILELSMELFVGNSIVFAGKGDFTEKGMFTQKATDVQRTQSLGDIDGLRFTLYRLRFAQ